MRHFSFSSLKSSDQYFVSNVLGEWALLDSYEHVIQYAAIEESPPFPSAALSEDNYYKSCVSRLSRKYRESLQQPSLVMVVPTLRCDHSCAYCQVSRAHLDSKCHDLELDPTEVAKWFLATASASAKLEFQGGEPLLRQAYIRDTVNALDALTRYQRHDVVIATALGPDLDADFLDWCADRNVQFSVSFDGVPELHNRYRRSNIFDSYSRFRSQLEVLQTQVSATNISFVATLTAETVAQGAANYIASLRALDIHRIFSRPVMPYGFGLKTAKAIGVNDNDWHQFMLCYLDELVDLHASGVDFVEDFFNIYLTKLIRPGESGYVDLQSPAGYALSACILNYDGYVYGSDEARMLYEVTKDQSLRISKANQTASNETLSGHAHVLKDTFIEANPHCDLCAFQPFCGTDPMHHLHAQGDPMGFQPDSHTCKTTRFICEVLATRIKDGYISQSMLDKWLN